MRFPKNFQVGVANPTVHMQGNELYACELPDYNRTVGKMAGTYMRRGAALKAKRVLIVEDEVEVREEYKRLMREKHPGLSLAGETDDTREALRILQSTTVDAVILDLELGGDFGISFLDGLNELKGERPFVVVVTKVTWKDLSRSLYNRGANCVCIKGGKNFTLDKPLTFVDVVAGRWKPKESMNEYADNVNLQTQVDVYRNDILGALEEMGFPDSGCGTEQCVEALLYIVLSEKKEVSITKDVYPYVAYVCKTNGRNVEINIRKSIEKVWLCGYGKKLRKLYPYEWSHESGRPTNAEFLRNMAKKWIK